MSVLLRERFQETFLDALKVHLRISSISKCTCFGDEDSLKDPQHYVVTMFKSHKIYSVNLCVVSAQYANSFV